MNTDLRKIIAKAERTGKISKEDKDLYPTLHFCPDWDEMVIESSTPEFETCTCEFSIPSENSQ